MIASVLSSDLTNPMNADSMLILLKAGKVFLDGPTSNALSEESISLLFDTRILVDRDAAGFFHSRIA